VSGVLEYDLLGTVDYLKALDLQRELVEKRLRGEISDRLLLLEHPPVVTQGKRECSEDFLSTPEEIEARGIEIVRIDRGGRLTYHGPGQLIGYFICEVSGMGGVRKFVGDIEEMIIAALKDYGIGAHRDAEYPGVWVGLDKVAAVGLHVSHGVTSHGFALNVDCDLTPYRHIVACGIRDRGVTTMREHAAKGIHLSDAVDRIVFHAGRVFGRRTSLLGLLDGGEGKSR
jgi:lipoate-protein ligase B